MTTSKNPSAKPASQFALLAQRRYGPFFLTQLAGAFNDNLFKQVLVLLVTFHAADYTSMSAGLVTNLAAGLFILPFVLFSAVAGQLADRYDKASVIRWAKAAEVVIMLVATVGFFTKSLPLLLTSLFLMGAQSAFFGPAKYALLPRVLHPNELTAGNALLETGTFLAILGGTLSAGVLIAATTDPWVVSATVTVLALAGYAASLAVPANGRAAPELKVRWNFLAETWRAVRLARDEGLGVWRSILGISWFWFYGALVLSQVPLLARDVLAGDTTVVTVLLAVFSVGVAIGSLGCERLSDHKVEIGLVPLGSIGLTAAGLDLWAATAGFVPAGELDWAAFLATAGGLRILADIFVLGASGGLFIVPLYAFVQLRTDGTRQSRIISANNILNALFMVAAAGLAAGLLSAGLSVPALLGVCAALNALVALAIYRTVPEFLWRFVSWVVAHAVYRLRIRGRHHIPLDGPAILAPNHVTYVDALVLSAVSPRPIRFVMDVGVFRIPVLSWLFRQVRAIPVAPAKVDAALLEQAFEEVAKALVEGELVCVFPEGRLTRDGELGAFRPGIKRMLEETPVPVIPVALRGLWGSVLCRDGRPALARIRGWRPWRRVGIEVGEPLPADVRLDELRARVEALGAGEAHSLGPR